MIGDKAYDSDPLDAELAAEGIELIAPHRRNRKKPATQDGRKLRRYKRRWARSYVPCTDLKREADKSVGSGLYLKIYFRNSAKFTVKHGDR